MTRVNVVVQCGMDADCYPRVHRERGEHLQRNFHKRITINSGFVINQSLLGVGVFGELVVVNKRIGSRG